MELRRACRAAGIGVVSVSEFGGSTRLHRAVPALSARLVMSLDGPLEVHYDGIVEQARAFVSGLMRPGVPTPVIALRSRQPTAYLDLSPATLQWLTGLPLSELDAGGLSADSVLPWVRSLGEELAEHPTGVRETVLRGRILDELRRAERHPEPDVSLRVLDVISGARGSISVDDLAHVAHLSPRRLRHVMRRSLGVTPKFASRVARLNSAVGYAGSGARSWADVAAGAGYHDQSHLVHEFHDLMGVTPTAWLDEEGRNLQGWRRPAP